MKVVFIVGPTASGKSRLALQLAERTKGVIVNCDSIQVYQGLRIGSATPSAEDRARVAHYLFEYVAKGQKITAGQYSRDFFALMRTLEPGTDFVFVVGGTGFYFQAIEKGMYPVKAANERIKAEIENQMKTEEGVRALYAELQDRDPATAARISINDHYRLGRAVELMRTEGRSLTEIQKEFQAKPRSFPYPLLKLGLRPSKEELLPLVEQRVEKMLKSGLVEEVKQLLEEGLREWDPLFSVGYAECVEYLSGATGLASLEQLRAKIVQNTMRLAKKQKTWFQRDQGIHWLDSGRAFDQAMTFIEN